MFISQAYAQAAAGGASPSTLDSLQQFAPLILIVLVFYLLLLRPQQKKAKLHREMVSNLRRGDRVVTSGGLLGQVSKVINETEVQVEFAEGVRMRVLRTAVTEVLAKTEPVSGGSKAKPKAAGEDGAEGEDKENEPAEAAAAPANSDAAPARGGLSGLMDRLAGRK